MRISFTGDIMCELPSLRRAKRADGYCFDGIFAGTEETFRNTDYLVGNLETVFAGPERDYSRDIYSYNTPDSFAAAVKAANFHMVSTANNHCLDRGIDGLRRTLDVLDEVGIKHAGTARTREETVPLVEEIGSFRVGFLAYTYGSNYAVNQVALGQEDCYMVNFITPQSWTFMPRAGWSNALKERLLTRETRVRLMRLLGRTYNIPRIDDYEPGGIEPRVFGEIAALKEKCDRVILLLHAGGQFNGEPGRYTQTVVEELAKTGVDAIIGNHPHVVQSVQMHGNTLTAYSLGNFFIAPDTVYLIHQYLPLYSIVLHMDLTQACERVSYSFSIVKNVLHRKKETVSDVWPLYQQIGDRSEKERLLSDCRFIYERVTGKKMPDFTMKREYLLEFCE